MRLILFVLAIIAAILMVGAAGEKHGRSVGRAQATIAGTCYDVLCRPLVFRLAEIEKRINDTEGKPRYLALGDSVTAFADLPNLCGREPINAGIIGATTETFSAFGRMLTELAKPDLVIVELGTNDALQHHLDGYADRLHNLIGSLGNTRIILIAVAPENSVPDAASFNEAMANPALPMAKPVADNVSTDGVHLTQDGYRQWDDNLRDVADHFCNK
jgi:lysophospholipase L1-like esterase